MGKGFAEQVVDNRVTVGGAAALVVSASVGKLRLVVPRVGEVGAKVTLEVAIAGSPEVGSAEVDLKPYAGTLPLMFIAEPFPLAGARTDLAVLSTPLGPAFVIASTADSSAAERAFEAQQRLNASTDLRALDRFVEVRDAKEPPYVTVNGSEKPLLQVTAGAVAAYQNGWKGASSGSPDTAAPGSLVGSRAARRRGSSGSRQSPRTKRPISHPPDEPFGISESRVPR